MFTPEIMDDTYTNMEVALPRDTEGTDYPRVTKRLKDANGLPIGTSNENPILDTRVYEFKYVDGHKASLTENATHTTCFHKFTTRGTDIYSLKR